MKIVLFISKKDKAGINIKKFLIKNFIKSNELFENNFIYYYKKSKEIKLYTTDKDIVFTYTNEIEADLIIFASRHSSVNKIPCYTCHATGNWDKAELGGKDKKLSLTSAYLLREIFLLLNEQKEIDVFQEVSHHGPLTNVPSIFIEIGSTENEWINEKYGEFLSNVIIKLLNILKIFNSFNDYLENYKISNPNVKIAIGLGGLHHMNSFKKLILNENIAFSHVCPKYCLDYFNINSLNESIDKTIENIDLFILDWKSMKNKENIVNLLNENKKEWKKIKQIIS